MESQHQLGDLQHAIMRVLWELGEASVAEVHEALLESRGLAPTTIATMLTKLVKKEVVTFRKEGRRFIYVPAVDRRQVRLSMVGELAHRLFDGRAGDMVSHLLSEHAIDADELDRIKAMIEKMEESP
ncbi:MAG: BlaI/MecI/CopY family transcriptional regulator [Acidobacteriota bacterium]